MVEQEAGSTAVVVFLSSDHILTAWTGDSRAVSGITISVPVTSRGTDSSVAITYELTRVISKVYRVRSWEWPIEVDEKNEKQKTVTATWQKEARLDPGLLIAYLIAKL